MLQQQIRLPVAPEVARAVRLGRVVRVARAVLLPVAPEADRLPQVAGAARQQVAAEAVAAEWLRSPREELRSLALPTSKCSRRRMSSSQCRTLRSRSA